LATATGHPGHEQTPMRDWPAAPPRTAGRRC
jgi:hypothetical protein